MWAGIGDMVAYRPNTTGVDVNPSTVNYCRELGLEVLEMKPTNWPLKKMCMIQRFLIMLWNI